MPVGKHNPPAWKTTYEPLMILVFYKSVTEWCVYDVFEGTEDRLWAELTRTLGGLHKQEV